ncbi:uncharacterized protein [Littorina saxatilis]|uniref:uncharacterized protein n=1 Tax=Littorina saxatilis TaxID=31220 RepID=UPI0038B4517F
METSSVLDNQAFEAEGLMADKEAQRNYWSISIKDEPWQVRLSQFREKKMGSKIKTFKSRKVRSFYKAQDNLIEAYEEVTRTIRGDQAADTEADDRQRQRAMRYSQVTFLINFLLMAAKVVASVLSGSLSIISSLIDSVVDLLSGIIMWWAARTIQKRHPDYPQGRTKLEPVSIVILSVIMAVASIEFARESVTKIIELVDDPTALPTVEIPVFVITGSTVVVKFILWLVCRRVNSNIVQALALDHRNDVMSNVVAIICGYLGSKEFQAKYGLHGFIYVDPGGAILISLYIIVNWCIMGRDQVKLLTGHRAEPKFLSKVLWVALNHDPDIHAIDTVRAFHFGNDFLVDVDIVLPRDMTVETAHDIAEGLQRKLERLEEVERAYVHIDYETEHTSASEHKVV